jgi:hypothetical protein
LHVLLQQFPAKRILQSAMPCCRMHRRLHLDLTDVMCYIRHALIGERSGARGKFAIGGFWRVAAPVRGEPDRDRMASLPWAGEEVTNHRDDPWVFPFFVCEEAPS